MIKALFFDIDGTLVSFKTHQIPVSTIEALEAAKAKGIQIFISTGRPRVIINNLAALQERKLIDGYITRYIVLLARFHHNLFYQPIL